IKMKKIIGFSLLALFISNLKAQDTAFVNPNTSGKDWHLMFNEKLSNAIFPAGVWTMEKNGVMTASKDEAIWSEKAYDNFVLDLEFKNPPGTNSGVIVHASDIKEWIPHSVEIQIA